MTSALDFIIVVISHMVSQCLFILSCVSTASADDQLVRVHQFNVAVNISHHRRTLSTLLWDCLMLQHPTLLLCRKLYNRLHIGSYDGFDLNDLYMILCEQVCEQQLCEIELTFRLCLVTDICCPLTFLLTFLPQPNGHWKCFCLTFFLI